MNIRILPYQKFPTYFIKRSLNRLINIPQTNFNINANLFPDADKTAQSAVLSPGDWNLELVGAGL